MQSHLKAVAERAERNASCFGAGPIARLTGLLHDLGKYTQEFQLRLSGEFPQRMDHATWGARVACERYKPLGHLLAYSIVGHHAGLANGRDGQTRRALQDRLNDKPEHSLAPVWQEELHLPSAADLKRIDGFQICQDRLAFQQSMLGRMIFSCLVDADFLDTEEFYVNAEGRTSHRSSRFPSLDQLRGRLELTLSTFKPDTAVNCLRAEILARVRKQAEQAPGRFSLTVPTGGGKTLASLAFALDHAICHGLRRVIYVIPFTSIVEQNAAVFRNALGELGEAAVLEHHSAFVDDPQRSPTARAKLRLAMENWDAPIVITTAVQFFESLFADRPSRCRKLHNIAGSVVILDEAQTLPLKLLRPCVTALDELALNYRTSIVLCTATQPALTAADGFRDGFTNVRELAPSPQRLYEQFRRVRVRHAGRLTQEALVDLLCRQEQVLCIVNNRRHARALYESIAAQPGARHLTTLMCARHRTLVLNEVRRLLKDGKPCR
ncbi:MAG: CRISPR-associated endonuclease Cas3'', partial [Acidobacteriaceae bacterium]|nr:CRISPR-associated endonuclease Cas3'' [Acidobacteriaceae bacterium]